MVALFGCIATFLSASIISSSSPFAIAAFKSIGLSSWPSAQFLPAGTAQCDPFPIPAQRLPSVCDVEAAVQRLAHPVPPPTKSFEIGPPFETVPTIASALSSAAKPALRHPLLTRSYRRQFAGGEGFEAAEAVEQGFGGQAGVAGVEAGAELVEQLRLAQGPLGVAAGAAHLLALDALP